MSSNAQDMRPNLARQALLHNQWMREAVRKLGKSMKIEKLACVS
jgi:hypothetical protein